MKFSKFQTRMENGFSELKLEAHSFRSYRTGLTGYFIESCRLSRWAEIGNRWRRDCHHLPWSILNYASPSNHCSILAFSSRDPRFFVYAWIFSDKFGFELNESFQEIEGNEEKISSCVFRFLHLVYIHFSFALLEIRFKLLITMILISWLKYIGSRFKFPRNRWNWSIIFND